MEWTGAVASELQYPPIELQCPQVQNSHPLKFGYFQQIGAKIGTTWNTAYFRPIEAKIVTIGQNDHDSAQLQSKSFHMNFKSQESMERLWSYVFRKFASLV